MKISRVLVATFAAAMLAHAVDTRTWQQGDMSEFEKGELNRISLTSDGHLTLAPVVKEVFDPSVTFLWAIARDSKGNLYTGGGGLAGSKAKLFTIDPAGKAKTLAELDGLAIQAIAVDAQDRVYAATSPDGKVYRVDAAGKVDTFYDPKAKYIWALAFAKTGELFVATGEQGEIHRVTPAGVGTVFFRTEETHARSLAVDPNGNLIVGTDPSGLILRVTPAGQGFVLYQASKREITSVAVAPDGNIYAAAVGTKQPSTPPQPTQTAPAPLPVGAAAIVGSRAGGATPTLPLAATIAAVSGGSDIYRIQADGYSRRVWTHGQDLVYALTVDSKGHVLAGTGNHGTVYRIDSDHSYTRLMSVAPTQLTGFASAPDGKLYAVTGNIGKVFSIGPDLETSGTFDSEVFDAGAFSYWGRVSQEGTGNAVFETRSGNLDRPQKNWSAWEKLNNGRIVSPAARFLQYRANLSGSTELTEIDIAYEMKNVAPVIEELETTLPNYKFPAPAAASTGPANPNITLPPLGRRPAASNASSESGNSPSLSWQKGEIGARWLASDDNGDRLIFKIEIRGVNETGWKLLKDKIRERYFSWDSTAFPDGHYALRITASDSPSNPPGQELESSRETDSFRIDNTPPQITGLTGAGAGLGKIEVRFHAKDALSVLDHAEYSVNGGEWLMVEPTTRLTDSTEHDYRVVVDRPGAGETTIAVRVADEFDNQAVEKVVVR